MRFAMNERYEVIKDKKWPSDAAHWEASEMELPNAKQLMKP